ncbi:MAG TPA: hypothetical protein VE077_13270 [Candidatus Methylomirabilis sp.]|nr:hypothetical protein [Candidatus Methylomirabilis sp.]
MAAVAGAPMPSSFERSGEVTPLAYEVGSKRSGFPDAGCARLTVGAPPASGCRLAARTGSPSSGGALCSEPVDEAPAPFFAPGKEGSKISEAREDVLEILGSPNACTEWFESKDPQPARTFQTLAVEVDRQGPQSIFETSRNDGMRIFRQPYVARTTQDGGPFSAITINASGAFYYSQLKVMRTGGDGGPYLVDGLGQLTVGSYSGDTLAARIVTLLHELGHVIDLLPQDGDDLNGSSIRNTNEVLRHCGAAVDVRVQQAKRLKRRLF